MPTKVQIASQAVVLIGGEPFASLSGTSTEQIVADTLYEDTVRELLAGHNWRFAMGQVELNRLAEAPVSRWDAAYQIPTAPGAITIKAVTIEDQPIAFDRYENKLTCNAAEDDVVVLDYVFDRPPEDRWPAYFTAVVKYELAMQFALAIPGKIELAEGLRVERDRKLLNAKLRDSQGRTARPLFTASRLLGGRSPIRPTR